MDDKDEKQYSLKKGRRSGDGGTLKYTCLEDGCNSPGKGLPFHKVKTSWKQTQKCKKIY